MSETLNVNVIVAAKDEYTKQLITLLQPEIYDLLKNVFINSQKINLRRKLSYSNYQKELKQVPHWSSYTLEEYLQKINNRYPYLMDLITAIFVSHVKILACVRIKADDKPIKIKVPNLNNFLHKIIINASEQIYYCPDIINDDKEKLFNIINTSITDTITNQVPLEYILNEYLSGAFDEEESQIEKSFENLNDSDNLFNQDIDDDLESNYENELKKNIPIGEISKLVPSPVTEQIQSVNENVNVNVNENVNNNDDDDDDDENDNENINDKDEDEDEDENDNNDNENKNHDNDNDGMYMNLHFENKLHIIILALIKDNYLENIITINKIIKNLESKKIYISIKDYKRILNNIITELI